MSKERNLAQRTPTQTFTLPVRKTKQKNSGKRDTDSSNTRVHGIYITAISVRLRAGVGTVMRLSTLQIMQHEKVGEWTGNNVDGSGPELCKPF